MLYDYVIFVLQIKQFFFRVTNKVILILGNHMEGKYKKKKKKKPSSFWGFLAYFSRSHIQNNNNNNHFC